MTTIEDLPLYVLTLILYRVHYVNFEKLFYINKYFNKICFNKFSDSEKADNGNLIEFLYRERKRIWLPDKVYNLKLNMTDTEFVIRSESLLVSEYISNFPTSTLNNIRYKTIIKNCILKGKIFSLKFVSCFLTIRLKNISLLPEDYYNYIFKLKNVFEVLDYLKLNNKVPNFLNWTLVHEYYTISKWYIDNKYEFNEHHYNIFIRNENYKQIEFLIRSNIYPNQNTINHVNSVTMCIFLSEYFLFPDENTYALNTGNYSLLRWLLSNNIKPTPETLCQFVQYCGTLKNTTVLAILKLYEEVGLYPSKDYYSLVSPSILEWLNKRNLII